MRIPQKDLSKVYIKGKKFTVTFNEVRRWTGKLLQCCMCKIRTDLIKVGVAKMESSRLIIFRKEILIDIDGRLNSF